MPLVTLSHLFNAPRTSLTNLRETTADKFDSLPRMAANEPLQIRAMIKPADSTCNQD